MIKTPSKLASIVIPEPGKNKRSETRTDAQTVGGLAVLGQGSTALFAEAQREIPLSLLIEVPNRKRKLTPEQYAELKANIEKNSLISPITVRRLGDKYEIIAGHNRTQVFRDLGKEAIPAVIREFDDEQAELAAFYSNLLAPALPDFEKYLGFKRRQEVTGKTQEELAEEAGISRSQVAKFFTFDNLPSEALDRIRESGNFACIGSNAVAGISGAYKRKKEKFGEVIANESLLSAINKLIEDPDFAQKDAIALVASDPNPVTKGPSIEPTKIKVGRANYCTITERKGILSLKFKDETEATFWHEKLKQLIEEEKENRKPS